MVKPSAALAMGPISILKEGAKIRSGIDARMSNIMVAKIIAELLRSTIGPRGMNKMVVSARGEVKIVSDGATLLKEIDNDPAGFRLEHPVAKMMLEAAEIVEVDVGDGTATVLTLIGELLDKAEYLLNQKLHPTTIIRGYQIALEKALHLLEKLSISIDINNDETLKKIALTAMNGRAISIAEEFFADLAVKISKQIVERKEHEVIIDIDQVNFVKKRGGGLLDTKLIRGVILDDNFVVLPTMPKRMEKAKIALLWCSLTLPLMISERFPVEKKQIDTELRIKDPAYMRAFLNEETKVLREIADRIKVSGANVVICQKKEVDDKILHFLAKEGIMVVRRATEKEMRNLARATGGSIIMNIYDLRESDLGYADVVEEVKIGNVKVVRVEGCKNPKAVSILIRGGCDKALDEAEGALHDAIRVLSNVMKESKVVFGGGAIETEVAKQLRRYAKEAGRKEQLAIESFANSLEIVPKTLAENAGLDTVDLIVSMRTLHEKEEGIRFGIDALSGRVSDMAKIGVLEPLSVKKRIMKAATETSMMILRIDEFIASKRVKVGLAGPAS